ncbi:hypothetical protein A3C89_00635 [Candidatus Kaiserbacteria bacterium RIFCSPHIGHO2_02_FULL_50_50]|uniref:Uncharacterized protein n=1 Tax=Candidatus Kaiserbacteria bacterium RIFCSPHIGHO2_02_FULL_50_50 TaxID=1798492 RepID=A0A1F6DFV3_9BACT|nr:MAG: hypothetical protein A3C89_00635 [Candidatus Kaiserbacteria bacterium RIFCSPHIGHO2_02_FULL_50_50]OGG88859.1 MAG: hypothetical protein A3G62_03075 [Candidatus Kaiserbacteria bacterium RIFCSPLOWO2_12_FULL_50_10]
MSLSMLLLTAGSYLLAIMAVWFAVLEMRRKKSIARGILLWLLSVPFAFVASYAFGGSFLFVPDFMSHINGIVLLAYFAIEFLLYAEMQGGRTQIYWLILGSSFLVVLGLIGGYFVPNAYHEVFFISIKLPIFLMLAYMLVYVWPTFIHAHLRVLSLLWGAVLIIDAIGELFFEMPELLDSALHMSGGVLGVFFIIGYLNALDMREYLPALYYFNTRRALLYTVCVLLAAAGLVALM